MEKEDIKNYIKRLLNRTETTLEENEIEAAAQILEVYKAGLERKPINLDIFFAHHNSIKEIPPQFHTLVAELAIIKSKFSERNMVWYSTNRWSTAKKQQYGGHLYDSGFEAGYAADLDIRLKAKEAKAIGYLLDIIQNSIDQFRYFFETWNS